MVNHSRDQGNMNAVRGQHAEISGVRKRWSCGHFWNRLPVASNGWVMTFLLTQHEHSRMDWSIIFVA